MSSDEEQRVLRLQSQLPGKFNLHKCSDEVYELRSETCVILVQMERFNPDSVVVRLSLPDKSLRGLHMMLLTHLRGAAPSLEEVHMDTYERVGRTLAKHFRDILEGDFSIAEEYRRIENRFFVKAMEVRKLSDEDPIKKMFRECNIAWLGALESRESSRLRRDTPQ